MNSTKRKRVLSILFILTFGFISDNYLANVDNEQRLSWDYSYNQKALSKQILITQADEIFYAKIIINNILAKDKNYISSLDIQFDKIAKILLNTDLIIGYEDQSIISWDKLGNAMKKNSVLGVLFLLTFAVAFSFAQFLTNSSVKLDSTPLNSNLRLLEDLSKNPRYGIVVNPPSGEAESLISYVGLVMVKDDGNNSPWNYIGDKRPSRDRILVTPTDEKLYEGILTNNVSVGGDFTVFATNLEVNEAAEVLIHNDLIIGYKDRSEIPWDELKKIPLDRGKSYYFIESATLTTTTYKEYRKVNSTSEITGTAFGANGEIFTSNEGFASNRKLSLFAFDLRLLRSAEGSSEASEINKILLKEEINSKNADMLLQLLSSQSFEAAKKEIPFKTKIIPPTDSQTTKPSSQSSKNFDVRIHNVTAMKQPNNLACWATVATMLDIWKQGGSVSIEDFLQEKAPDWLIDYQKDRGLLAEDKDEFLKTIGLTYEYGASYLPTAIENMLQNYGPLWFTINAEDTAREGNKDAFSIHASLVIGLFGNEDVFNELYISYIDPADGQEHDELYADFMRRYEEPAHYYNNQASYKQAYVEGKFYPIHVVHYPEEAQQQLPSFSEWLDEKQGL